MFGVVFAREVRTLVRNAWAPAALILLPLCGYSGLVLLRWPAAGRVDLAGERSTQVFRLFAYVVAASILLLAPALPATAIVGERRRGTLALLLNTPLTGARIYWGKLASGLVYALLPVWMSLPAASACYALGSVRLDAQIVPLYLVLFMMAVQCNVIALTISARARSAVSSMRWAYASIMVVAFASLIPMWIALKSQQEVTGIAYLLRGLSPVPAMMEIAGQRDAWGQSAVVRPGAPLQFCVTVLLASGLLAAYTIRQLRPERLERSRSAGIVTDDRSSREQFARRLLYLVDPQRRTRGIPSWLNPVLAKEFLARRFGRRSWTLRILALCAIVSLGATFAASTGAINWSPESIGGLMVQLQVLLIVVITPSLASGLISDELEHGGWALLRMTPLTVWQIVAGKLLSVAFTATLLLLATLPGYAVMMIIKPIMRSQVVTVLVTLGLTAAFCIALGAAISSLSGRTSRATVAAYAANLAIFGIPLGIWYGRGAPFGSKTVEAALTVNPVAAALSAIEAPGFESYHLLPVCWYVVGGTTVLLLAVMVLRTHQLLRPE